MNYEIIQGDALQTLKTLPANSVQCCVTSPPYFGLRDYGTATWEGGSAECDHLGKPMPTRAGFNERYFGRESSAGNKQDELREPFKNVCGKCGARRIDSQIGLEETPEAYVAKLVDVFREVRRVLRDDGTLWLNLGDSYASNTKGTGGTKSLSGGGALRPNGRSQPQMGARKFNHDVKEKDLIGIPWRVAFALRADGWYLRQDIIWDKGNPMPESVTDRCTKSHEYIFLLSKSPRYYYDAEAIREPNAGIMPYGGKRNFKMNDEGAQGRHGKNSMFAGGSKEEYIDKYYTNGRNKRSVWRVNTRPYAGAHFAVFPEALITPCILAGTSAHGACSNCGSPWARVTEEIGKRETHGVNRVADDARGRHGSTSVMYTGVVPVRETTGWQPTCACNADVVPCVVLDPFNGSGTTGAVALKHGRKYIGLELNPDYIELAHKRIGQAQPMLLLEGA